jgi:hypothetical protein
MHPHHSPMLIPPYPTLMKTLGKLDTSLHDAFVGSSDRVEMLYHQYSNLTSFIESQDSMGRVERGRLYGWRHESRRGLWSWAGRRER